MAGGDLVQVTADGRGVSGAADRQNVLQQIRGHAVGHQRGPAGLQIEQFRGDALGQEQVQRAEGPGRPRLAGAAVKARTGQRDGAEGRTEPGPAGPLLSSRLPQRSQLRCRARKLPPGR